MGFPGCLARYRLDGHYYKNQSLVSVLPYADIGVIGAIAGFDEGDLVNTVSTVSQGRPLTDGVTLGH